jgi:hypothetical protein
MTGFYILQRGWMDAPEFGGAREEFCRRAAWIWMLEEASWSDRTISISGKPLTLRRGQLSHSSRHMARAWGWDEARVRRFLARLIERKRIDASTDAGKYVLTICNYDAIQGAAKPTDAGHDAGVTQERRGDDANKKEGKEGKERKIQRAAPSGRAAPDRRGADLANLMEDVHAPTARDTVWRDGPAIVRQLTQRSDEQARKLLGKIIGVAKQDFIRVVQVLHKGQEHHPLMDPEAWLMAAARGANRDRPAGSKLGWLLDEMRTDAPRPEFDLDLKAEAVGE